ncbi:hypothetical protein NGI46_07925 [Peribacillus butanolivorans]|uniref:hypothetical protein n=1 Tax=Peribacillus butanolivorans TaxID=421767 RepID=UPI00207CC0E2|nr:hypothetical protein [Peribacillus butanolivorans]MCO0597394.1 hypothetical protein [Peribacillus butanolivorans]
MSDKLQELKKYCVEQAAICNEAKFDEAKHKVDRVFLNGKERAYNEIIFLIDDMEAE